MVGVEADERRWASIAFHLTGLNDPVADETSKHVFAFRCGEVSAEFRRNNDRSGLLRRPDRSFHPRSPEKPNLVNVLSPTSAG